MLYPDPSTTKDPQCSLSPFPFPSVPPFFHKKKKKTPFTNNPPPLLPSNPIGANLPANTLSIVEMDIGIIAAALVVMHPFFKALFCFLHPPRHRHRHQSEPTQHTACCTSCSSTVTATTTTQNPIQHTSFFSLLLSLRHFLASPFSSSTRVKIPEVEVEAGSGAKAERKGEIVRTVDIELSSRCAESSSDDDEKKGMLKVGPGAGVGKMV